MMAEHSTDEPGPDPQDHERFREPTMNTEDVLRTYGSEIALSWVATPPHRRYGLERRLKTDTNIRRESPGDDQDVRESIEGLMRLERPYRLAKGRTETLLDEWARIGRELDAQERIRAAIKGKGIVDAKEVLSFDPVLLRRLRVQDHILTTLLAPDDIRFSTVCAFVRSKDGKLDNAKVAKEYAAYIDKLLDENLIEPVPAP